jgi:hypothetical protein
MELLELYTNVQESVIKDLITKTDSNKAEYKNNNLINIKDLTSKIKKILTKVVSPGVLSVSNKSHIGGIVVDIWAYREKSKQSGFSVACIDKITLGSDGTILSCRVTVDWNRFAFDHPRYEPDNKGLVLFLDKLSDFIDFYKKEFLLDLGL